MSAVLAAAAPQVVSAGFPAALVVAVGVTALVALGMMLTALHRSSRLTIGRGLLTGTLALGVVGVAAGGVLALSPASAQATPATGNTYVVVDTGEEWDVQLPTLSSDR